MNLMSPARLWKSMPPADRLAAAEAFWREDQGDIGLQHAEATMAIARRMNFRAKSVQALPLDRRAKLLAQLHEISDSVASRALISFHFAARRDLMSAFLDALGVSHDRGLIQDDELAAPDEARLTQAVVSVRTQFPAEDVHLYLHTLAALDEDTWAGLKPVLAAGPTPAAPVRGT
jgi:hypothetical protein